MDNQILITPTTKNELVQEILEGLEAILKESNNTLLNTKEWLTAKEVMALLKISSVTLYNYDKKGLTNPHKLGRNRRYRKDHIIRTFVGTRPHLGDKV